jgi:mRNA interferase RelE/StbE
LAARKSGCPHHAASRTTEIGPRPPGCKKLKGGDNEWRIRVGVYWIVYVIDDTARTLDITRIAHRREVYE